MDILKRLPGLLILAGFCALTGTALYQSDLFADLFAQQKFTITTPVTAPSKTEYAIDYINLNWRARVVEVQVVDNVGRTYQKTYNAGTAPTGQALMVALNKANLTTNTMVDRVLQRLEDDGVLESGTVTGTPE